MGARCSALEMRLDALSKNAASASPDVAVGEIDEGLPHPPHRVEHVHRALHDVGEMPPADLRRARAGSSAWMSRSRPAKLKSTEPPTTCSGGRMARGDAS